MVGFGGFARWELQQKNKPIYHPKPDLSFGRPPSNWVFFEGGQKYLQTKNFANKTQQQPPAPVGFLVLSSVLVSSLLRRREAFARGISEETSVSMRLREALGTLEASTGRLGRSPFVFFFWRLGGMVGDLFERAWQKENDLITSFTIFCYQGIHCLAGGFSFISLALFTGELKG